MIVTAVVFLNQNSCSLIISASRYMRPTLGGGATVTVNVTLAPGATLPARLYALLVSQYDDSAEPPVRVVKWRPRSTLFAMPDGHVWLPLLVSVIGNVWL